MAAIIQNLQQDPFKLMYQQQGINYVGLFGSYARGEQEKNSDVDLLINFDETKSLFDLARVKISFEDMLGKKVDLALRDHVKETLRPYIEQDLITVYEKN